MRNKPDPVDVHVGARLRDRRTLLGLSQGEVGVRLGLNWQQIQKYERGDFWLDHERGRDGRPKNAKLYICWYDARARRNRRRSTRTEDVELAKDRLDEHYLAHSRPPQVDPAAYALGDAITDYWIEHGQRQTSFDSIRARLNLVVRFLAAEIETGRMDEPVCVDAITDDFLARFKAWALKDPITWKNRKGRVILTKQRSEATVNEAVRQLRAAVTGWCTTMADPSCRRTTPGTPCSASSACRPVGSRSCCGIPWPRICALAASTRGSWKGS